MKWISLYKQSSVKQTGVGLLLGIIAFLLCFTLAVLSIVYSPSVYQTAYKKGCVDPSCEIDGDNFTVFYTYITDIITGSEDLCDADTCNDAKIKINGNWQSSLQSDDALLLSSFHGVYFAYLIIFIVSLIIIVSTLVIISIKGKKTAISNTAIWMLTSYICCMIFIFLIVAVCYFTGNDVVFGFFKLFSMDGILTYNSGNLGMLFGRITQEVFVSAVLKNLLVFGGVILVAIVTLVNLKFKKNKDINEDFLYQ